MKFELLVAARYLLSRKSHNAVNIISLISVGGVAVATMALVCVLSVFNGFKQLAIDQSAAFDPDLRISSADRKVIHNPDSMMRILRAIPGIEIAAPTIEERALAVYGDNQMPVRLKGVTQAFDSISKIRSTIKSDGDFMLLTPAGHNAATLSVGAAIGLGAHPGYLNFVSLFVPRRTGRINPANPVSSFRSDTLEVGGVFQIENPDYDTDMVIVPLSTMRRLLDYPCEATAIEIKLSHDADPAYVESEIYSRLGTGISVADRVRQQEQSFKMINMEKWITFVLLAFILIIASFNVISTLSMLVIEKYEAITIFKALGAAPATISRIFMLEGWLISLTGGIAGIVTGVALCLAQEWWGFIKLGGDHSVMTTDVYPVHVEPLDLVLVLFLVSVIGWITSTVTDIFTRHRLNRH